MFSVSAKYGLLIPTDRVFILFIWQIMAIVVVSEV